MGRRLTVGTQVTEAALRLLRDTGRKVPPRQPGTLFPWKPQPAFKKLEMLVVSCLQNQNPGCPSRQMLELHLGTWEETQGEGEAQCPLAQYPVPPPGCRLKVPCQQGAQW